MYSIFIELLFKIKQKLIVIERQHSIVRVYRNWPTVYQRSISYHVKKSFAAVNTKKKETGNLKTILYQVTFPPSYSHPPILPIIL